MGLRVWSHRDSSQCDCARILLAKYSACRDWLQLTSSPFLHLLEGRTMDDDEKKSEFKPMSPTVYLLGMILAVMLMWIGGAFASGGFFDQLLGGR